MFWEEVLGIRGTRKESQNCLRELENFKTVELQSEGQTGLKQNEVRVRKG